MATVPARQLNNKRTRSALLSKALPAVQGPCSLLSAKFSYNKHDATSCDDLWLNICQKRDECDEKINNMKGVAFFFSSVAALEIRSKEEGEKADSQEQEDDPNDDLPEKYWPAKTYWIAVQSSNGMRVSTVPLHSTLLETGMEVIAKALPVCKKGNEEESCAPLCTALKGHNNHFMKTKVEKSFSHSLQLVEEPLESLHASECVVRLQNVCSLFSAKLRGRLIPSLVSSGRQFDVFGIEVCDLPSEIPKGLASPIVIAMNDIERAMAKLGYALHKGEIFKKVVNSKYTYQHSCSVKKLFSLLGSNDQFKDTIIKHLNKLVEIFGDKECEFTKQLRANYDLIEVNGGWCFSISQRRFVLHAIKSTEIGKESPRAYINYEHTKTPGPGYFKQILQNSLTADVTIRSALLNYSRLTSISSSQKVFDDAIPPYHKALDESGYKHKLTYNPQPKRKRNRQRKIIWYNPPWNANVKTNLGRKFLNITDRCFPNGHPLHKIFKVHLTPKTFFR